MAEKKFETPKEERFEFVFSINGNIICQRYFKINNYQEKAAGSYYLTETIRECQKIIDNDLKEKSLIYLSLTAPQVFNNREEMEAWRKEQTFKIEPFSYVVLRDEDAVFFWNGSEFALYNKPFNRSDYVGDTNNASCVLKFSFLDNGEEVRSISWDGNVYPKFVRNNIDISNSKNKYKSVDNFQPYEAAIIDAFNADRQDIIPMLMKKITFACSSENRHYFSKVKYGEKEYDFNLKGYNERLFLNMNRRSK